MNVQETLAMAVKAIDDKNGHDVNTLDMSGISSTADYFVICHGNSETQVEAIVREIKDKAQENGIETGRIEGLESARWVLVDLKAVVVHVFHKDERTYYNLEKLWSDAPQIAMDRIVETKS
ncbi:ribosome silencing factor [Salisediminibacterium halotolerans]|uniref:Ribosomal silencing factor RsfS n=1 Tax=Salisediminibacterium halotolerans TaxID=517425 RepID=A0A1H9S4C2_9BACI|nr:ribosome silencing factor [Salisediminibacterium haloalkalitolerans]SER79872.1 ribosome-associated protein [Salisediminibacterium haloalkalitolerans]